MQENNSHNLYNDDWEEIIYTNIAIRKEEYHLPVNIWIDQVGKEPIIKIQNNTMDKLDVSDLVSVSINTGNVLKGEIKISSNDFRQIQEFILKNKDVLLQYFKLEISIVDLFSRMKE